MNTKRHERNRGLTRKGCIFVLGAAVLWLVVLGLVLEAYAAFRLRAEERVIAEWKEPTEAEKMEAYSPVIRRYQGGPLPEGIPQDRDRAFFLDLDDTERSALAEARGELAMICDGEAHVLSMYAASAPEPIALLAELIRGRDDIKYLEAHEGGVEPWRVMQFVFTNKGPMSDDLCIRLPNGEEELFQFSVAPVPHEDAKVLIFVRLSIWEKFWFTFRKNIDWDFIAAATSWEQKTRQFHTNNVGFRDDDVVLPKPHGVYRILCIGGSTTIEGLTNALTYPNILEAKLREHFGTKAIEVINGGVYGYRVEHERKRFDDFMALEPDLIVYYNFVNDLRQFVPAWAEPEGPWTDPVLALKKALRKSRFISTYWNWQLLPPHKRLMRLLHRDVLDSIQWIGDEAKRQGVEVAVCSFAYPTDLTEEERLLLEKNGSRWFSPLTLDSYTRIVRLFNHELRAMCEARGFAYVPVAENFHGGSAYFTDICHMNPLGIEHKAEIVFHTLKEQLGSCLAGGTDGAPASTPAMVLNPTPASPKEGGFGYRSFTVEAPWMRGSILVRFPEQLRSSLGLHFIDCGSGADGRWPVALTPMSIPEPYPPWVKDEATGALSYHYITPEGLEWWAHARPDQEEIALEFCLRNNGIEPVSEIYLEICTLLDHSEDFSFTGTFDRVSTWFDGVLQEVTAVDPPPEGRYLHIRPKDSTFGPSPKGRGVTPDAWNLHQDADVPIVACMSRDRAHLVAVSWFDMCQVIRSNANLSCIHAGPETHVTLGPGEEFCWHGRLYLMPNDPQGLLQRFMDDRGRIHAEKMGTLRLIPHENDRFLRIEDPEKAEAGFLLWAPESLAYPDLGSKHIPITWRVNELTGSVWYRIERGEALFTALFQPRRGRVMYTYMIQPAAGAAVPERLMVVPCHQLKNGIFAGEGEELMRRVWIHAEGRWVSVGSCPGRTFANWFEVAPVGNDALNHPPLVPLALPRADVPLIACVSRDGAWVTATSANPCCALFNNIDVPCIHAQPCGALTREGPTTLRGTMYLLEGSLDDLLREYQADAADAASRAGSESCR